VSAVLNSVIYSDKSCIKTRNKSQQQCANFGTSSPSHKKQPPKSVVKAKI